jgi:hypothetical protein
MRTRLTAIALALALGCALSAITARASDIHLHHQSCGYSSSYDVKVDAVGIRFDRDDGTSARILMHDGRLQVDGRDVAMSAADTERLRQYEGTVRTLMPEAAEVAREGVDIGFAAMRTVMQTFAENDSDRRRMIGRLDDRRREALAQIDGSLGRGVWKHQAFADTLGDSIASSVSELVGKVAASAVEAALSGDQSKVAALQARADTLDKSIDKEVNARADRLDQHARALCPRMQALEQLQQQFQFRLADGSRLEWVRREESESEENKSEGSRAARSRDAKVASR